MVKNLKKLRIEAGISQQQLADVIGVSQQSINKYENHSIEPDISIIIAIAEYFNTSVDYLVGNTDIIRKYEALYTFDLNEKEKDLIEKYRKASEKDRQIVDFVLK
ncbi:MAG: helix-turn-helix transcriptional regulator [Clostridia bacterium]|nr:helix-turn-helix transcriptional regulator [Clostridia bacterium]